MSNTTLSRTWLIRTIVGILLTGSAAWVSWASTISWKHETRITVTETQLGNVQQDVKDIKEEQKEMRKEMNQKLDRLIERRGRNQ